MDRLRHALKESLCDLFDKERLPASQPEANAFAMVLTSKLGSPYIAQRAVLYGRPHTDDTRPLLRKVGLQH